MTLLSAYVCWYCILVIRGLSVLGYELRKSKGVGGNLDFWTLSLFFLYIVYYRVGY